MLVRELCSSDLKLVYHVAGDYPQLIPIDMDGFDLFDGKVGVSFEEGSAVDSAGIDAHAIAKEDKVIAYIKPIVYSESSS